MITNFAQTRRDILYFEGFKTQTGTVSLVQNITDEQCIGITLP